MEELDEPKLRTGAEKLRPELKFLPEDEKLLAGTELLALEEKLREKFAPPGWRAVTTASCRPRTPWNEAALVSPDLMEADGVCERCEVKFERSVPRAPDVTCDCLDKAPELPVNRTFDLPPGSTRTIRLVPLSRKWFDTNARLKRPRSWKRSTKTDRWKSFRMK
jgi:hypothetical protein